MVNCSLAKLRYQLLNGEFHGCVKIRWDSVSPQLLEISPQRNLKTELWRKVGQEGTPELLRTQLFPQGDHRLAGPLNKFPYSLHLQG